MALKEKIILIAIILLGIFFRLYQLDKFPVSLNWDEISHSYNAYSIMETGKDQWGIKYPIFNFRAYGDYPTTLNMYLTIPFIKFFGLNEWSTRLPSSISGILIVILTYLIIESLFKNKKISLLATFLAAISPWTLFTSRAVYQSTLAQAFLLIGIYFLINYLFNKKNTLFISLLFFNISMYAYHNTRIFVPIFLFIIFITFYKKIKKEIFIFGIILMIPIFLNFLNPESRARSAWVSIINPSAIHTINESRRTFEGPKILAKILYNKITYSVPVLTKNTLNAFNPIPLFLEGSKQYQFNVVNHGLLYLICLPFFYIGLFVIIKNSFKDKKFLFLLIWYLIGLVPSIITTGDFPTLRLFLIIPLPFLAIALSLKKFSNSLIYLLFITSCLFSFYHYINIYTKSYATNYSQSWQYGYKEISQYIKENHSQYDQILITKKYGEPHEFLLYYLKYSPSLYQEIAKTDYHTSWYWVESFDKYIFINDWEVKEKTKNLDDKTLLITSPNNYNSNVKLLKTINFLDNTPAFDIVSNYEN
jgi:hypothetical protein